jgi:hypothetical protein
MRTKEISRNEWREFFDSFSRLHQGSLVTLEILGSKIGAQLEGRELAFAGVVAERDAVRGDKIAIMIGADAADHITHNIGRPIQVSLEQTDEGADVALAIKSADGVTALIRVRPLLVPSVGGVVTTVTIRW